MDVSRRKLLGVVAGGGVLGVAASGTAAAMAKVPAAYAADMRMATPFDGEHQAGIVSPQQDRLQFAAFDVLTTDRAALRELLAEWTATARRLTQGREVRTGGGTSGTLDAPPDDTGEAIGLPAAGLTVTFGVGPSLFDDRFGLADRRPAALVDLPHFASDDLDPERTGGDLCIQACAYDEQVALHAIRNLARMGAGVVRMRYVQLGHVRTTGVQAAGTTPRNLMGFKDGTSNLDSTRDALVADQVWVQPGDGPAWMTGGSYLVSRRIRMTIETWDRTSLREQEAVFGRSKVTGAPLSGGNEQSEPDFAAAGPGGGPAIPVDAHVRLAHPSHNGGAQLLRRGYNYADGLDRTGYLDAGLFFLAYQRDPRTQFVRIQQRLAATDSLNEYIRHVGSGIWAVPPGPAPGRPWAAALLA